jgi:DNA-binding HxlR family transcriptional regulator
MAQLSEHDVAALYRQMGEPSWYILMALHPIAGKPAIRIICDVETDLQRANHPSARLDPSTLARALVRMERLKLVRRLAEEPVEVPVGHGASRTELRPLWVITAEGETLLERWRASMLRLARSHSVSIASVRHETVTGSVHA